MRRDLEAAGIAYRDVSGRVVDFHAFRHTFVTRLAQSGVGPAVAREAPALTQAVVRQRVKGMTAATPVLPTTKVLAAAVVLVP